MKVYEYMVIFSYERGTGRICITRNKKIGNYVDVESLDEIITENIGIKGIAIDFKLLRTYKQN